MVIRMLLTWRLSDLSLIPRTWTSVHAQHQGALHPKETGGGILSLMIA